MDFRYSKDQLSEYWKVLHYIIKLSNALLFDTITATFLW